MNQRPPSDEAGRIDRRTAIKKVVVGGAVAGAVWTAPRVEGLSLRPNYAAAATAPTNFSITTTRNAGVINAMTSSSDGLPTGVDFVRVTARTNVVSGQMNGAGFGNNCFINALDVTDADNMPAATYDPPLTSPPNAFANVVFYSRAGGIGGTTTVTMHYNCT